MQRRLAARVDLHKRLPRLRLVAGADVAYTTDGRAVAAVVVLSLPHLETVEEQWSVGRVTFPYVPGLLSFREVPIILRAWSRLRTRPDLLVCDGQGLAHPRRYGLACHLGHWLDLPTVGCAKSLLIGSHDAVGPMRGDWTWLFDGSERIGTVLRTRPAVKPVFVSPGSGVTFTGARSAVLRSSAGYRLPEPTRRADILVARLKREIEWGQV